MAIFIAYLLFELWYNVQTILENCTYRICVAATQLASKLATSLYQAKMLVLIVLAISSLATFVLLTNPMFWPTCSYSAEKETNNNFNSILMRPSWRLF